MLLKPLEAYFSWFKTGWIQVSRQKLIKYAGRRSHNRQLWANLNHLCVSTYGINSSIDLPIQFILPL